jgi:hypothetical protein
LGWLGGVTYSTLIDDPEVGGWTSASGPPRNLELLDFPRDDSRMFVRPSDGVELSIFDLLPLRDDFRTQADALPLGVQSSFTQGFESPPGVIAVKTKHGLIDVAWIALRVTIERNLGKAVGAGYEFRKPDRTLVARGTQATIDLLDTRLRVNLAHPSEGRPGTVFLQREDTDRSRVLYAEFDYVRPDGAEKTVVARVDAAAEPG